MSTAELTDEIDTLGVAFHEVGHGLAAVKGGLHVKRLRIHAARPAHP
jgi:Zn-dependent oligopeptidase